MSVRYVQMRNTRAVPATILNRPLPELQSIALQQRYFTSSGQLRKQKKGKASEQPKNAPADEEDALSNDDMNKSIKESIDKLKERLSKLRPGGRFNPEVLEDLRVTIDKNEGVTERLRDLAQVVPRGRTINIISGEKDVCHSSSLTKKKKSMLTLYSL